MRELSIFIDESGIFDPAESHAPFYIVSLVLHNQATDISSNISRLHKELEVRGLPGHTIHAAPLIRREGVYRHFDLPMRKQIFNILFHFMKFTDIKHHSIVVEKRHFPEVMGLQAQLAKRLQVFLNAHLQYLLSFERIIVYYDHGQRDLTTIIVAAFSIVLSNVEFRKVAPANYKLFQAADMLCTLELLAIKAERKMLANSDLLFFGSERRLRKAYLRELLRKQIG